MVKKPLIASAILASLLALAGCSGTMSVPEPTRTDGSLDASRGESISVSKVYDTYRGIGRAGLCDVQKGKTFTLTDFGPVEVKKITRTKAGKDATDIPVPQGEIQLPIEDGYTYSLETKVNGSDFPITVSAFACDIYDD